MQARRGWKKQSTHIPVPCFYQAGPDRQYLVKDAYQLFEALSEFLIDHEVIKGARSILQQAQKGLGLGADGMGLMQWQYFWNTSHINRQYTLSIHNIPAPCGEGQKLSLAPYRVLSSLACLWHI